MPRLARLDAPGVLHHVMGRSIERREIFHSDIDRNNFIGRLSTLAAVNARRAMSWIGVRELGYSGADIARYIGVTNSCVTRMISSGKKPEIDDINLDL